MGDQMKTPAAPSAETQKGAPVPSSPNASSPSPWPLLLSQLSWLRFRTQAKGQIHEPLPGIIEYAVAGEVKRTERVGDRHSKGGFQFCNIGGLRGLFQPVSVRGKEDSSPFGISHVLSLPWT